MPVPGYEEFMRPLLEVISDGQDHNLREAYSQTVDRLGLTEADRQELIPSDTQPLLEQPTRVGQDLPAQGGTSGIPTTGLHPHYRSRSGSVGGERSHRQQVSASVP
jgi:restriction endonuclease Mrr